ncbi:hypothetical protein OG698_39565 [Streptomyces sp. NBC_01003]|uniref:hypothetical protein n=1 Tax=unclassified Streptomyces TaxID=2593676 RepID=UPI002DDC78C4|nr:hypothetical protein [Streptomyces sp. NBC_01445]WSE08954.1 hypothetical protein OG574_39675 [Streptomyces sp. NBC_01445]WSW28810.1 hypothetical protein OG698_39565 [Streptomyces sp. NBC_01003]
MPKIAPPSDASKPKRDPAFELRCGGIRVTIDRVPTWLVTTVTTVAGSGIAWWTQR